MLCNQVLDAMDIPFTCQGKQLCIGVTLGIACFPEDGVNEESLGGQRRKCHAAGQA